MSKLNQYPPEIEQLNVCTHLIGLAYGIIGAPFIYVKSMSSHGGISTSIIIFSLCFILMFFLSTLYHYAKEPGAKWSFKKGDHISIYFMIAGSYTPFMLIYLNNKTGLSMLIVMWALTLLGTLFKIYTIGKFKTLSTAIYVLMGTAILLISDAFFPLLPKIVLTLIVAGGIAYLVGVLFYLRKSWKYHHPIWHLFVLAGAFCHWWAVWFSL